VVTFRCRTCGRFTSRRGPCPICRVYGAPWEPTDRVEIHLYGTVATLTRDRDRWRKEALTLREVYRAAMAESDRARAKVRRAESVARRMERWEGVLRRCRKLIEEET